jgi:hypothetical protein
MELVAARTPMYARGCPTVRSARRSFPQRFVVRRIYGRHAYVGNEGGAVTGPHTKGERAIREPCQRQPWSLRGAVGKQDHLTLGGRLGRKALLVVSKGIQSSLRFCIIQ